MVIRFQYIYVQDLGQAGAGWNDVEFRLIIRQILQDAPWHWYVFNKAKWTSLDRCSYTSISCRMQSLLDWNIMPSWASEILLKRAFHHMVSAIVNQWDSPDVKSCHMTSEASCTCRYLAWVKTDQWYVAPTFLIHRSLRVQKYAARLTGPHWPFVNEKRTQCLIAVLRLLRFVLYPRSKACKSSLSSSCRHS